MKRRNETETIHKPPRWADQLLEWCCAPHLLEEVQGDMHERFRKRATHFGLAYARRQYGLDVLGFLRPVFLKRQSNQFPTPYSTHMLRNYLTTAFRHLQRRRSFSGLNIAGLALGIAACLLILQYVAFELSFDRFHPNADRIYGLEVINQQGNSADHGTHHGHGVATGLKNDYPEVEEVVLLHPMYGGATLTYYQGADIRPKPQTFYLKGHADADTVSVAGSFNGWNRKANLMSRTDSGWVATLDLTPGEYAYKLVVDGTFILDPANPLTAQDGQNTNSVLRKPLHATGREVTFTEKRMYYADEAFLRTFPFPFLKGNPETALREMNSLVVTQSYARKYFRDEDPMGKMILLNGRQSYVVTGIMKDIPANSHLQFDALVSLKNIMAEEQYRSPWDWENFNIYVKLKPGSTLR